MSQRPPRYTPVPATAHVRSRKAAFDRLLKVEEYRESAERLRDTVNLIRDRVAETRERIGRAEGALARYEEMTAEHKATAERDRKSTRLNSSHANISYAVFCL